MESNYWGFCDIYYIIKTLQRAIKAKLKQTGVDQAFMYEHLFAHWSKKHNQKYGSKGSLSVYFGGIEPFPPKFTDFYMEKGNFHALCKDIEGNILPKLADRDQVVKEIFEALDSDDHIVGGKRIAYCSLRSKYFPDDRGFVLPQEVDSVVANWEAHLLADILLFVITDPQYLRVGSKRKPVRIEKEPTEDLDRTYFVPEPFKPFFGREEELQNLDDLFKEHRHIFLTGLPGIGKSELAKNYAACYRKGSGRTFYIFYTGDMRADIIRMVNTSHVGLSTQQPIASKQLAAISEKINAPSEDLFQRCLNILQRLSENDLLVIDNFDALPGAASSKAESQQKNMEFDTEPLITEILNLRCRLLISTRCDYQQIKLSVPYFCVKVKELDANSLMKVFSYYYSTAEKNKRISKKIIETVFQNTLIVKMVAKLLEEGFWSAEEVLQKLQDNLSNMDIADEVACEIDGTLYEQTMSAHIHTLLGLSRLTDSHLQILMYMSLMPQSGVPREVFRDVTGLMDAKILTKLNYMGFMQRSANAQLSMHRLIRKIILQKTTPNYINCSTLLENINKICIRQLGEKNSKCEWVSKIIESMVPQLDTSLKRIKKRKTYFHFVENAIPFQLFFSNQKSALVLQERLEKLVNLAQFDFPVDRLICCANRIILEDNYRDTPYQKFDRMFSVFTSVPFFCADPNMVKVYFTSLYRCLTEHKGERMLSIIYDVISSINMRASSKIVRLFLFPASLFIAQKELSKEVQQLPAQTASDCSTNQIEQENQMLFPEPGENSISREPDASQNEIQKVK